MNNIRRQQTNAIQYKNSGGKTRKFLNQIEVNIDKHFTNFCSVPNQCHFPCCFFFFAFLLSFFLLFFFFFYFSISFLVHIYSICSQFKSYMVLISWKMFIRAVILQYRFFFLSISLNNRTENGNDYYVHIFLVWKIWRAKNGRKREKALILFVYNRMILKLHAKLSFQEHYISKIVDFIIILMLENCQNSV